MTYLLRPRKTTGSLKGRQGATMPLKVPLKVLKAHGSWWENAVWAGRVPDFTSCLYSRPVLSSTCLRPAAVSTPDHIEAALRS